MGTINGEELTVSLEDGVLTLCIRREARANAISPDLAAALAASFGQPPTGARVVLLRSAGTRVFCAGMDLTALGSTSAGDASDEIRKLVEAMRNCALPTVVRVQGLCLAGGVGLALAGDLVVCSEDAEWGLPEIDRGLWPFMVGMLLARQVPEKRALDWMLTGRRFSATEASAAGLVSRLVPADGLDTETEALCTLLAGKAPLAVLRGKAAFRRATEMPAAEGLAAMGHELAALSETADAREGIVAFAERRPPRWQGR